MDNTTLSVLQKCKPIVDKVFSLQNNIIDDNDRIGELVYTSEGLKRVKHIWVYILVAIIGFPGGAILALAFYLWKRDKNKTLVANISLEISSIETDIKRNEQELLSLLKSEEGRFAADNIPKDYFYPNAIDRFIYYFSNGHVETMKEALKEYDSYMHNCRMEYEASRAADANERTAAAAERTARAAEATARNTAAIHSSIATIEQYTSNINFWTTYTAYNDLLH